MSTNVMSLTSASFFFFSALLEPAEAVETASFYDCVSGQAMDGAYTSLSFFASNLASFAAFLASFSTGIMRDVYGMTYALCGT